jgi:hypothetical protein
VPFLRPNRRLAGTCHSRMAVEADGDSRSRISPARYSETGGLELRPLIKCEHLTTKQVCGNCNSGWTSGLEAWAQNRLGPYVEPAKEFDGFVGLQSMPDESQMIVRWLLKTAIIVERALPMADTAKVPPALYPVAKGTHPPTHFWAWAAYIVEPAFELHLLPGFPVWNGGVLQPFQVHAENVCWNRNPFR